MAKVTKILEHDWLAVRVTFPDGTKANVTWNRGGENVVVTPTNPQAAELLSLIVMESKAKLKSPGYPFDNLGKIAGEMEKVAKSATSLNSYLEGLERDLKVTGERPKPKAADTAPAQTLVDLKKSRGWQLQATFPTGERVELKINARSVALAIDPNISPKWNEISNFVFGVKQSGIVDDEKLARALTSAAEKSGSLDEWIANMRSAVLPGS